MQSAQSLFGSVENKSNWRAALASAPQSFTLTQKTPRTHRTEGVKIIARTEAATPRPSTSRRSVCSEKRLHAMTSRDVDRVKVDGATAANTN